MRMILFITLLGSLFVQAQETKIKKVPITRTSATSGQEMFVTYCAACHGKDGKGDGPAVAALKGKPADLTQLAKKNGGIFPQNHVAATISSVSTPAHGSKEMPMWGPLFSSVSSSQGEVQLRVANLTRYIETLQEK